MGVLILSKQYQSPEWTAVWMDVPKSQFNFRERRDP
ncbi:hypothetical protein ABIB50_004527 [Mucilaginibacter sp. UYCu711]